MIPLSVRIKSSSIDRHVTNDLLSGPTFRSVVPGGFASCTFTLSRPLGLSPQDLRHMAQVYVYSNLGVVWEGRIEDLGRTAGDQGEVWEVACIGSAGHTSDQALPLIYSDSEITSDRWQRFASSTRSANVQLGDDNTVGALINIKAQEGEAIYGGGAIYGDAMYRAIYDCGQKVARVRFDAENAVVNADYSNRIVTRQGPGGAGTNTATAGWSSFSTSVVASSGGFFPIPSGHDVCHIRWVRVAAGNIVASTDNYWGQYSGINVRSMLMDASGNDITSGYSFPSVLAHEVVADLLGRCLDQYDGPNALVESTLFNIEQLAYPGGVTPKEVLDDLLEFEPGMYYAAWESGTNGLYRFEFRAWPSSVRYEADVIDGYSGPSSAAELYNRALVSYIDWRGRQRTTTVSQSVPALDALGIERVMQIDAGNEISSVANAQRIGEQQLADHAAAPNAGTLTVGRPIYDRDTNRMVMPYDILPGRLIRIRGIQPSIDSLNATVRDGTTVFKIVGTEYSGDTGQATLELDSHSRSDARYLSRLARVRKQRRKR